MPFVVGDLVELVSGGPQMTVVTPDGAEDSDVEVVWFAEDEMLTKWLPVNAVRRVNEGEAGAMP